MRKREAIDGSVIGSIFATGSVGRVDDCFPFVVETVAYVTGPFLRPPREFRLSSFCPSFDTIDIGTIVREHLQGFLVSIPNSNNHGR